MTEVIKVEDCGENIGDHDVQICKAIIIPKGATNGDMIEAMFPNIDASVSDDGDIIDVYNLGIYCQTFDSEWWYAPYNGGLSG